MVAIGSKGIRIEERSAVESHAGDESVMQCSLQNVVIFRVAVQQKQAVVDIYVSNGSAGLAICSVVRQIIISSECLAVMSGADSARDIKFLAHGVVPDLIDRLYVGRVACEGSHIRHAGIHVAGAHSVTYGLILLRHRFVRLTVTVAARRVSAFIQEIFGLVEILLVAGDEIQLSESHLRNLMSRHTCHLPGTVADFATYAICILYGDIEKLTISRGLIMCYRALHHVS